MKYYYISFGVNHNHRIGSKLFNVNTICAIKAESHLKAREIAFKAFGPEFCTSYNEIPNFRVPVKITDLTEDEINKIKIK